MIDQSFADEAGGKGRDVDADPLAAQHFGGVNGCATAAERIKYNIAGVG